MLASTLNDSDLMKGVYPTLSHSILLLLGMMATSLLIASVTTSLSRTEVGLISTELNFIGESIKEKILETYSLANQTSNYTEGIFLLDLPEKIGNSRYTVTLYQNTLQINATFKKQDIELNYNLPIDAELSGKLIMPASLKVEKENGKIKIGLIK